MSPHCLMPETGTSPSIYTLRINYGIISTIQESSHEASNSNQLVLHVHVQMWIVPTCIFHLTKSIKLHLTNFWRRIQYFINPISLLPLAEAGWAWGSSLSKIAMANAVKTPTPVSFCFMRLLHILLFSYYSNKLHQGCAYLTILLLIYLTPDINANFHLQQKI